MKRVKVFSGLFLVVSIGAYLAFQVYSKGVQDNTPPVVTCETDEITVPVNATPEELMEGVTAKDKRSGDVSDTLVIEKISSFTDEGERIITYAAIDKAMNVGRCQRTVHYSNYTPAEFGLKDSLMIPLNDYDFNLLENVVASSTMDGDLSSKLKYSLPDLIDTTIAGDYPVEFRVSDSGGHVEYLNTNVMVCDRSCIDIKVELKEYLIYLKKGAAFDPGAYYVGADIEGELSISSNVDTSTPGTYYVDYSVGDGARKGVRRMVVVVR